MKNNIKFKQLLFSAITLFIVTYGSISYSQVQGLQSFKLSEGEYLILNPNYPKC